MVQSRLRPSRRPLPMPRLRPRSASEAIMTADILPRVRATIAAALAMLLLLVGTPAFAQSFPAFTGLVVDAANVLPPDRKAALEQKLEAFQQKAHRQLVVATIPDL